MYYRELTSTSEGCPVMSGNPDKWIGWALHTSDKNNLLICDCNGDPIFTGEYWWKYEDALKTLLDAVSLGWDAHHTMFRLSSDTGFPTFDCDLLARHMYRYDNLYSYSTGAALWHIARDMGEDVEITPIHDARETGDDITIYYLGKGMLPTVAWDIESYYYDYLTELIIDDGDFIACIPTYIIEETDVAFCTAIEEYLHLTGFLNDNEELIERPDDGYSIEDLIGVGAVCKAIDQYLEHIASDMSLWSSDICYTFEDCIYNLKEGGYRFDIDGNLLG